jgi:hypothetical protein
MTFRILNISVNHNALCIFPENNRDGLFQVKSVGEQYESGFSQQIIGDLEHGTVSKTWLDSPIKTMYSTQGRIIIRVGKSDPKLDHLEQMLKDKNKKEGIVIRWGVQKSVQNPVQYLESLRITKNETFLKSSHF